MQGQAAHAAAMSLRGENGALSELIGQKDMQVAQLQNQLANMQASACGRLPGCQAGRGGALGECGGRYTRTGTLPGLVPACPDAAP